MKKSFVFLPDLWLRAILLPVSICAFMSCNMLGPHQDAGNGELRIAFAGGQELLTRAGVSVPDTSDFILTVKDSEGMVIYEGAYKDSPESMSLLSGNYTVSVVSQEFVKPAFSSPQFGDEQCVVVPAGGVVDLKLVCRQINAGIRLKVAPAFLDVYPDGVLLLKASSGRLIYGYSEKRVAYFNPGSVSMVLNANGKDQLLMTRELNAQEVLELKVEVSSAGNVAQGSSGKVSVTVDTTRNWISDTYVIGGGNGGSGLQDAMTLSEAMSAVGQEDVWVSGFIVGGDLSSSSASFEKPFSSRTNILLGPRSSVSSRSSCMSVQLAAGSVRDALNLVDNPSLLGRKVCLKGDVVEAYYGLPGIKNIVEFELQ